MRIGLFWLSMLLVTTAFAQKKYVVGRVLDAETHNGVDNQTVLNKRTKQIARTNKEGKFYLIAQSGDSLLVVESMTVAKAGIVWDGTTPDPVIWVKAQANMLAEVVITSKKEEQIKRELEQLLREPQARKNLSFGEALSLAQSPITMLYELFSKRAKADRKLAVLMQEDRRMKLAEYRMATMSAQVSKYRGTELEDFMYFCSFTDVFLLEASEYELTYQLLECKKQFEAQKVMRQLKANMKK